MIWSCDCRQWAELLPAEAAFAEQHSPNPNLTRITWISLTAAPRSGISPCSVLRDLHSTFQKTDSIPGKHSTFFVTCSNDSYMYLRDIILCEFLKETAHSLRDGINVMKCLGALPSCWLKQTNEAAFHSSSHREKTTDLTALPALTNTWFTFAVQHQKAAPAPGTSQTILSGTSGSLYLPHCILRSHISSSQFHKSMLPALLSTRPDNFFSSSTLNQK